MRNERNPASEKSGARANPVDVYVGSRVRQRRTLLGLSQEKLGEAVGLTFQQVQKYERGANRIGASRLFDLGRALNVPVGYFFQDMPVDVQECSPAHVADQGDYSNINLSDSLASKETLDLVRAYYKIKNPKIRKNIFELANMLAKEGEG